MLKDADAQIPNYPNLPWKMVCLLHSVTLHVGPRLRFSELPPLHRHDLKQNQALHCSTVILGTSQADPETDEVYAQMTLQPANTVSTSLCSTGG